MRWKICSVLACFSTLFWAAVCQYVPTDADRIEYDRRLAEHYKTKFPAEGVVPNEETATSIAFAVAVPVWGNEQVSRELPLKAGLKGNVWTVIGSGPKKGVGGELIIQLDKRTGAVLSLFHTQ